MKTRFIFFSGVFWLFFGVAHLTYADIHLKIGVYQNKPKVFIDNQGKAQGLFVDIIEHIAGREG